MNCRRKIFAAPAILGLACAMALASAQAQTAGGPTLTDSQTIGSWTVHCVRAQQTICEMEEVMVERNSDTKVASVAINYVPKSNTYFGRFGAPLGVAFEPGLELEVGAFHGTNLRFGICAKDGCYVTGLLPSALMDAMKDPTVDKGDMDVQMIDGRKIQIPIALNGFADGLDLLKKWTLEKSGEGAKSSNK